MLRPVAKRGRPLRCCRALSSSSSSSAPRHPAPLFFTTPAGGRGPVLLSPWHDLPLRPAPAAATTRSSGARAQPSSSASSATAAPAGDPAVVTFVCEVPRGARAKLEISTSAPGNPLVQDATKSGAPRFYALDSLCNYGALPRTYEDPARVDALAGAAGDGDPLDVCDVSSAPRRPGAVYAVRVLGALAMLDGGEADWKVLAIREDDPLAREYRDVGARGAPPALLRAADALREWFRVYKVPEGKGENTFALGGRWLGADDALAVVAETHEQWRALVARAAGAGAGAGEEGAAGGPWVPPQPAWSPARAAAAGVGAREAAAAGGAAGAGAGGAGDAPPRADLDVRCTTERPPSSLWG